MDASSGAECALSDGDALELVSPTPADATTATLLVLSSKGGQECRKASSVLLVLNDLQEMQNHMREMIDQGLQELRTNQGKQGLPALPPSAAAPPVDSGIAQNAPPTDPKGADEIAQQLAQADQSEKDVNAESTMQAPPSVDPPAAVQAAATAAPASVNIEAGQTINQVTAQLGSPLTIVNMGSNKMKYIYKDLKVTFTNGKVSDFE